MSTLAYVTTGGHYTLNQSGFYFEPRVNYNGMAQSYYLPFCHQIGAWGKQHGGNGGYIGAGIEAYCRYYATGGPYYADWYSGTPATGSISAVALCAMTANAPDVSGTGSASWSTTATKYENLYVASGASVKFTATPKSGYKFLKWKEDYTTQNPKTVTVTDDVTYTPIFVPTSYTLNIVTGTGGNTPTVYVNGAAATVTNGQVTGVKAGDSVSLTALPQTEYLFSNWVVNGFTYYGETQLFTMPEPVSQIFNIYSYYTQRNSIALTLAKECPSKGDVGLSYASRVYDWTTPVAGTASSPASVSGTSITVTHTGASDTGGSVLKHVELWASKDGGAWADTTLRSVSGSGSFSYTPSDSGRYAFRLVAEDNGGNRSAAAAGSGDCSTAFTLSVPGSNVALSANGGSVVSVTSQYASNPVENMIDGSTSTRWRSNNTYTQNDIVIKFSEDFSPRLLNACSLYNYSGYRVKDFEVYTSDSDTGEEWGTPVVSNKMPNATGKVSFSFGTPVIARRILLRLKPGYSSYLALVEFEAIGDVVQEEDLECSIGAPGHDTTYGDDVSFTIKFTRDVTGFTVDDITLNKTGTADGTLGDFSGEGDTYTVSVTGISGAGTIGISVTAGVCADAEDAEVLNKASNTSFYSVAEPVAEESDWMEEVTLYVGVEYTLAATVKNTALNMFAGWYSGATLLSEQLSYTFTPATDDDLAITAKFAQKPSYTVELVATDGTIPYNAETDPAVVAGCTLAVRDPDFETPDEWIGGYDSEDLVVTATPATGWQVIYWQVLNSATGTVKHASDTSDLTYTFTLDANVRVVCVFERITLTASVMVDAASVAAEAGIAYLRASASDEWTVDDIQIRYGDSVYYNAATGGAYAFAGWYGEDGVLVSAVAAYTAQDVSRDLLLTAKFKTTVELTAANDGSADGSPEVQIDDGEAGATAEADVIIGDTCVIKATGTDPEGEDDGSVFDSWYQTTDETFDSPIVVYTDEATITVTGATRLTARFVGKSDLTVRVVAIRNYNNNSKAYSPLIGAVWADGFTPDLYNKEIPESDWNSFFYKSGQGFTPPGSSGIEPGDRYYQFKGTKAITLNALPAASVGFLEWRVHTLIPVSPEPATGEPNFDLSDTYTVIGKNPEAVVSTNQHYFIVAAWGDPTPVKVQMKYGTGSDSTMGSFDMQPENERTAIQGGISDLYIQGVVVPFSASSANGYVFSGWFRDAACTILLSSDPAYALTVSVPTTVYAKFAQDTDAIYKWEGGDAKKMMRWISKRYVATKPFNPSAARVYADAYPATLNLYACSSPDTPSSLTPAMSVSVMRQDGVRLPMSRAEKYYEIEVISAADVTDVTVSTSMGGLAQ